jgi:mannosyltransferase
LRVGLGAGGLLLIFLLAAGVRFYNLGAKGLWLDEVLQGGAARYHSLGEVIAWTRWDDQMPLLNGITWLMRGVLPNDALLRTPSAIAGLLTVVGIYLLGRALFGRRAGLIAAVLTAVWPFAIAYSQEARPYALLIMATTFQMYFAYQVVVRRRLSDGLGLALASLINLYSHYMGLAATAAAAVFVGVALLVHAIADLRRRPGWRQAAVQSFEMARPALLAALLILVGYLPWARTLRAFLQRPTVGFARYVGQPHQLTLSDVQSMLAAFDFTGPVLLLLGIGVAACVWWAARGQVGAALLGTWIIVPLAGLLLELHGSIALVFPRYLSFLLPAGILIVTVGIEGLASLIAKLSPRRPPPSFASIAAVILTLAVAAQLVPITVSEFQLPKDEYRAAANLIVGSSRSDSVVLAVGSFSDHVMIGLSYYLQAHHSSIALIDGSYLDDRSVARIEQSRGTVWGAVKTGYPDNDLEHASTSGLELHRFTGITVIPWPSGSASAADKAKSLLRWASTFEPRDRASSEFLDAAVTRPSAPSLLPAAAEPIVLRPHGEASGLPITIPVTTGEDLLASFTYRNEGFSGQQLVLISAADPGGHVVQEFPTGQGSPQVNGYQCLSATDWTQGAFAFRVPPAATSLTIWLRATGTGVAEFQDVKLLRL